MRAERKSSQVAGVLLAAGKGTRMGSERPKVLHEIGGLPLIVHGLRAVIGAGCERVVIVVGHGASAVEAAVQPFVPPGVRVDFALQAEQLGTGHAALCAAPHLEDFEGALFILPGDVPLVRAETLASLLTYHRRAVAAVTVLTTRLPDAKHYGRIVRGEGGAFERIVEARDSSPHELKIREINTGAFALDARRCFALLRGLGRDNAQGEYYLTDVIAGAREAGDHVLAHLHDDMSELMGINDRFELAEAESRLRRRINETWMGRGVSFVDPQATYVAPDALLGPDTSVGPGALIDGDSRVGPGCTIGAGARLLGARLGEGAIVGPNAIVSGPLAAGAVVPPGAHHAGG